MSFRERITTSDNSFTHFTNKCVVFRNIIQDRIDKKLLRFPNDAGAMKVNTNPFPKLVDVDMISICPSTLVGDTHFRMDNANAMTNLNCRKRKM